MFAGCGGHFTHRVDGWTSPSKVRNTTEGLGKFKSPPVVSENSRLAITNREEKLYAVNYRKFRASGVAA